jgi:hypothetical protein
MILPFLGASASRSIDGIVALWMNQVRSNHAPRVRSV